MNNSPPKAYIFDVFGTLTDWRTSIAREIHSALPDLDSTAFAEAWRGEYQPAMERIRSGNRGYISLDQIHSENLERVLDANNVPPLDPEKHQNLSKAWERLDTWPDVKPGLKALKEKGFIAPCSNGSIAMMTRLARHAGLPWDCILGADIAQDYKPKPEVYQASCRALGLAVNEVMMVAAHNDDLMAAAQEGLQTCFITRPTEYGPDQSIDLKPSRDWTRVIKDLSDLTS